jgi:hypothetical protein
VALSRLSASVEVGLAFVQVIRRDRLRFVAQVSLVSKARKKLQVIVLRIALLLGREKYTFVQIRIQTIDPAGMKYPMASLAET